MVLVVHALANHSLFEVKLVLLPNIPKYASMCFDVYDLENSKITLIKANLQKTLRIKTCDSGHNLAKAKKGNWNVNTNKK
jgi:hypothetical protein